MSNFINLHQESLYLQWARDLLLQIERMGGMVAFHHPIKKDDAIYNKAIFDEILHNRESLVKFISGYNWRYNDHERDKKNKLVKVKVEFDR